MSWPLLTPSAGPYYKFGRGMGKSTDPLPIPYRDPLDPRLLWDTLEKAERMFWIEVSRTWRQLRDHRPLSVIACTRALGERQ